MTVTLTLPFLMLAGFSLALFIGVTIFCHFQGLFDNGGGYLGGIDALFTIIVYSMFWAVPSLMAWAVWATWFR